MKTTAELIERISPRYKGIRKENVDFLWEDFLGAIEKVIGQIPDKELAATSGITIFYVTRKGDCNIYRSKIAERYFCENGEVEYEKDDICLGTREMLEIAFVDFKAKAEKDNNICADWFDVEDFKFDEDDNSKISLGFKLPKIL